MVSNLKRYTNDPQGKGRGPGLYYHRGNGVWSKYTEEHDGKIWHRRTKVKNVIKYEKDAPHKGDYKTLSRSSGRKTTRIGQGRKGYF